MIWRNCWICESSGSCCPAVSSTGVADFGGSLCWSLGWLRKGFLHRLLASRRDSSDWVVNPGEWCLIRCGLGTRPKAFFVGPYALGFLFGPMLGLYVSWARRQRSEASRVPDTCHDLDEGQKSDHYICPLYLLRVSEQESPSKKDEKGLIPSSGMTFNRIIGASSCASWVNIWEHLRGSSWSAESTIVGACPPGDSF